MSVSEFLEENFRHFNARELLDAARAYRTHVESGKKMLVAIAGAMSTAELGISLAKMIRADKVHAISCTAANFEEDLFNLFAHNEYRLVPEYRDLSPNDEEKLRDEGFNRVTDTCIPEDAIRHLEQRLLQRWLEAEQGGEKRFSADFFYEVLEDAELRSKMQVPRENSWGHRRPRKEHPRLRTRIRRFDARQHLRRSSYRRHVEQS